MKPRITVVTIGVDDLDRAVRFYREGLGLQTEGIVGTEFEHGAVAFFDLEHGLKLALWPRNSLAHDSRLAQGQPMIHEYAAIDPMALLFPSRLYIELSEKLHPHVPKSIEIKEALGRLTPEERKYILVRARMLSTYSKAVEEAVASMK